MIVYVYCRVIKIIVICLHLNKLLVNNGYVYDFSSVVSEKDWPKNAQNIIHLNCKDRSQSSNFRV